MYFKYTSAIQIVGCKWLVDQGIILQNYQHFQNIKICVLKWSSKWELLSDNAKHSWVKKKKFCFS